MQRAHRADPDVREQDAGERGHVERCEEEHERGKRDDLRGEEERERRERLPEPDRAAVARREHEAVEHAVLLLRNPGAREPEQRGEHDRDPEEPVRGVVPGSLREREVEDDEGREDEEEHRRQRVARAQLDPEVLARERRDVGEVGHASASLAVARRSSRARSCVDTTIVRCPASSSSSRSRRAAPCSSSAGVRLVEDEQVGLVEQRPAEREALRHAARVGGDPLVSRVPEPEALEQHPDALPPLGHAVEPCRTDRGSRAR